MGDIKPVAAGGAQPVAAEVLKARLTPPIDESQTNGSLNAKSAVKAFEAAAEEKNNNKSTIDTDLKQPLQNSELPSRLDVKV